MAEKDHPAESPSDKIRERQKLVEKRCENCNKLLFNHKNINGAGTIEEKCRYCGHINRIDVSTLAIK